MAQGASVEIVHVARQTAGNLLSPRRSLSFPVTRADFCSRRLLLLSVPLDIFCLGCCSCETYGTLDAGKPRGWGSWLSAKTQGLAHSGWRACSSVLDSLLELSVPAVPAGDLAASRSCAEALEATLRCAVLGTRLLYCWTFSCATATLCTYCHLLQTSRARWQARCDVDACARAYTWGVGVGE